MHTITDEEQAQLRARNAARAAAAKEKLGTRHVFHPSNRVHQRRKIPILSIRRQLDAFLDAGTSP